MDRRLLRSAGTSTNGSFIIATNMSQILVEPMNATAANRKGIEYVVTWIDWY
jgi:hypothetical protein